MILHCKYKANKSISYWYGTIHAAHAHAFTVLWGTCVLTFQNALPVVIVAHVLRNSTTVGGQADRLQLHHVDAPDAKQRMTHVQRLFACRKTQSLLVNKCECRNGKAHRCAEFHNPMTQAWRSGVKRIARRSENTLR